MLEISIPVHGLTYEHDGGYEFKIQRLIPDT
jgi:hypothetical protein